MDVMSRMAVAGASIFTVGAGATVDAGIFDTRYSIGDAALLIIGGPEAAAGAIDVIVSYGKAGSFTTKLLDTVLLYSRGATGAMTKSSVAPDQTTGAIRVASTAQAAAGFTRVVELGNLFVPSDVDQVRVSIVNNGTVTKTFATAFLIQGGRYLPDYGSDLSA